MFLSFLPSPPVEMETASQHLLLLILDLVTASFPSLVLQWHSRRHLCRKRGEGMTTVPSSKGGCLTTEVQGKCSVHCMIVKTILQCFLSL
jgi:hypothetical protein